MQQLKHERRKHFLKKRQLSQPQLHTTTTDRRSRTEVFQHIDSRPYRIVENGEENDNTYQDTHFQCDHCGHKIASSRYAPHLERCMIRSSTRTNTKSSSSRRSTRTAKRMYDDFLHDDFISDDVAEDRTDDDDDDEFIAHGEVPTKATKKRNPKKKKTAAVKVENKEVPLSKPPAYSDEESSTTIKSGEDIVRRRAVESELRESSSMLELEALFPSDQGCQGTDGSDFERNIMDFFGQRQTQTSSGMMISGNSSGVDPSFWDL